MPLPPKELSKIFNSTNEQSSGIINVEDLAEDSDHAHEVQEQTGKSTFKLNIFFNLEFRKHFQNVWYSFIFSSLNGKFTDI